MKLSPIKNLLSLAILGIFVLMSQANAGLIKSTDGNLIYDDVSDITWLADTNYSKTDGTDLDGKMTWDLSMIWAADLMDFHYFDWRLPTWTESLALQYSSADLGLFTNIPVSDAQFWTSTENFKAVDERAYWFRLDGSSNPVKKGFNRYAWAVTDGDIAQLKIDSKVSEPTSLAIFMLCLAGLMCRQKIA